MAGISYKGKNVLVTGGGSGIGRALALALADEGAYVVITDIDQKRISEVVAELDARGAGAEGHLVDNSDEEATAALCKALLEDLGHIDLVCANAGIGDGCTLADSDMARWRKVMDLNFMGVAYLLHYLVPSMIERQQGQILITSSGAGLLPGPGMSVYHASKAAAASLGASLRCELEQHGIKVSVLCPGVINTAIIKDTEFHVGSEEQNSAAAAAADELYNSDKAVDPSVVARDALRGLRKNRQYILSPWSHVGPAWLMQRLSPDWFNRLVTIPNWRKGQTIGGIQVK